MKNKKILINGQEYSYQLKKNEDHYEVSIDGENYAFSYDELSQMKKTSKGATHSI